MSRRLLLALAASGLSLHAASPARADSHHQIVSQTPIKQNGKTIGFRATLVVDPENRTGAHETLGGDVRIGLGSLKYTGDRMDTPHRESMAGVKAGYILHQFKIREITGPNPTDRGPATETLHTGGKMKEVEIEVHYADNPALFLADHGLLRALRATAMEHNPDLLFRWADKKVRIVRLRDPGERPREPQDRDGPDLRRPRPDVPEDAVG